MYLDVSAGYLCAYKLSQPANSFSQKYSSQLVLTVFGVLPKNMVFINNEVEKL
jgi:hypothetical protein